jgi:hypothetical protein
MLSISGELKQAAFSAFDEVGTAMLKPVFDKMNGELNYEDLKVLRLMYLAGRGER